MTSLPLLYVANFFYIGWIAIGMYFAYMSFVRAGDGLPRLRIYSRPAALFLLAVCAMLIFYPFHGLMSVDAAVVLGSACTVLFSYIGIRGVLKYLGW